MKLNATFDVECETEGDADHKARYYLELALARAKLALRKAYSGALRPRASGQILQRSSL
jgi:hypothetical protein